MAQLDFLPHVRTWLRKNAGGGTPEQVDVFVACCDRQRLDELEREMRELGRALRDFVRADDELARQAMAAALVAALEDIDVDELGPLTS